MIVIAARAQAERDADEYGFARGGAAASSSSSSLPPPPPRPQV